MPAPSKRALALRSGIEAPAQRNSKDESFLQALTPDPARQQEERQANDEFNQQIDLQRRLILETRTRREQAEVERAQKEHRQAKAKVSAAKAEARKRKKVLPRNGCK